MVVGQSRRGSDRLGADIIGWLGWAPPPGIAGKGRLSCGNSSVAEMRRLFKLGQLC